MLRVCPRRYHLAKPEPARRTFCHLQAKRQLSCYKHIERERVERKFSTSHKQMEEQVRAEYEQFNACRKKYDAEQADAQDLTEFQELEQSIKNEHQK